MSAPHATYRLQFCPEFGFSEAEKIIDYLSALGISHIYASPIFTAVSGSSHGYDVIDPNSVNPELGGLEQFRQLLDKCAQAGLGWIQDIVPNHVAYSYHNVWLRDVLEKGPCSKYFGYFDINWDHYQPSMKGRVIAPFLGNHLSLCVHNAEVGLQAGPEGLSFKYFDVQMPLNLECYAQILDLLIPGLRSSLGANHTDFQQFLSLYYLFKTLPAITDPEEKSEQADLAKSLLQSLCTRNAQIWQALEQTIQAINRAAEINPGSLLHNLILCQHFRLSYWKVATEEINYRRFFNINDLICLRTEDVQVFNDVHSFIFSLVDSGKIDGLRIDHLDGLFDPADYLFKLRHRCPQSYIIAEKILDMGEKLPRSWPIQGTTGYDFLNQVNSIFCNRSNRGKFQEIYRSFTGIEDEYQTLSADKKRLVLQKEMSGELDNLVRHMQAALTDYGPGLDLSFKSLSAAVEEILVRFPVYRTYVDSTGLSIQDEQYIREALDLAAKNRPELSHEIGILENLLLPEKQALPPQTARDSIKALMHLQQLTGPLMAKGFEDTLLYIYNRLISLNNVGSSPEKFGSDLEDFHSFNEHQSEFWPRSLKTTSTHDSKRGEDARARINILSEIPAQWQQALETWRNINSASRINVQGRSVPNRNEEYFLYQTLLGSYPFDPSQYEQFRQRIKDYVIKALRESKLHSDWINPDQGYEQAFLSFIDGLLPQEGQSSFLKEFMPFQKKVAFYGLFNSLAQTILKITSPGIPDFYQGSELWDLNLVDPDNRRPVDYSQRMHLLSDIRSREKQSLDDLLKSILQSKESGQIKLFLIYRALQVRLQNRELFDQGSYLALETEGPFASHLIAFARNHQDRWALTLAPRFLTSLIEEEQYPLGSEVWQETRLIPPKEAPDIWYDFIGGQKVEKSRGRLFIRDILHSFPVALLLGGRGYEDTR